MGRGKAWSSADDEGLCHAWLHVRQELVKGTGQKNDTFWARVTKQFQSEQPEENHRNIRSVTSRWGIIHAAVSKFCVIWSQVSSADETGASPEEHIRISLESYQDTHPKRLAFEFLRCWYVLRDAPKWTEACAKDRKGRRIADENSHTMADSKVENAENPSPSPPPPSPLPPQRAPLSKKPKTERSELQLLEIQANAAKMMAEATSKKVQLMQDQVQMDLFTMRDDDLPEASKRFFELKRAQVLRELEAESKQVAENKLQEEQHLLQQQIPIMKDDVEPSD